MISDVIEPLGEAARWRARDATYSAGLWQMLRPQIPQFTTEDFRVGLDGPANPYMRAVVRQPRTKFEQPIPVGTVSNSYTLAQHAEVAARCFDGISIAGIETEGLRCELGLTELGEWMNLRILFPNAYDHGASDGERVGLRLECFNSVDGSCRLRLLLGWIRFICSNGMVVGETLVDLRDIHNQNLDLERIPTAVVSGLDHVSKDGEQLRKWELTAVKLSEVAEWADKALRPEWNKTAACRVFHICQSGRDVEIANPFAPGEATTKPVNWLDQVPGARVPAANLYDVAQALSWVASKRNNPDERIEWQSQIPGLVDRLAVSR